MSASPFETPPRALPVAAPPSGDGASFFEEYRPTGVSRGDGAAPFAVTESWRAPSVEPPRAERHLPAPAASVPPPLFPEPPTAAEARWAFYDRLDLLRRGRWIIAGAAAAALLLAVLALALRSSSYEAYSLVLVQSQTPALDATAEFAPTLGGEQRTLMNQALILQQNPAIAEAAAGRILAAGVPAVAEDLPEPVTPEALGRLLRERVIRVAPEAAESNVIRLSAAAPTPEEAARLVAAYTEEYVAQTRATSLGAISGATTLLDDQLTSRRAELADLERDIERFESTTGSVDLPQQASARIGQVAQLEAQLDRARVERQLRTASLGSLETELATLQPRLRERLASGAEQELARLNERIAEAEQRVESIYQRNPSLRGAAEMPPEVAEIERQLVDLRAQRSATADRFADEAVAAGGVDLTNPQRGGEYLTELRRRINEERVALAGAEAEMEALRARLGQAQGALGALPERQMRLAQLRRQQQSTERSMAYLAERLDQTRLAEQAGTSLVQIVRPAEVPTRSAGLPAVGILGLALVLGLVFGIGGAAARHRLDRRLYAPRDLHATGLPVLGVLPALDSETVALDAPLAPQAEAFRHLLAHLRRGPGGPRPQALVVAAPETGTGASTVAVNLAAVAAQGGLRTLLVDADLRHPTAAARLGLTDEVGAGQNDSPLVYWTTPHENLYALTGRAAAHRAEALWNAGTVRELLRHVRPAFDLIVFDAPPALTAADASVLAGQTDAVVLVARAGATHADALAQAAAELHEAGGEVLGATLTGFDARMAHGYDATFGRRFAA